MDMGSLTLVRLHPWRGVFKCSFACQRSKQGEGTHGGASLQGRDPRPFLSLSLSLPISLLYVVETLAQWAGGSPARRRGAVRTPSPPAHCVVFLRGALPGCSLALSLSRSLSLSHRFGRGEAWLPCFGEAGDPCGVSCWKEGLVGAPKEHSPSLREVPALCTSRYPEVNKLACPGLPHHRHRVLGRETVLQPVQGASQCMPRTDADNSKNIYIPDILEGSASRGRRQGLGRARTAPLLSKQSVYKKHEVVLLLCLSTDTTAAAVDDLNHA